MTDFGFVFYPSSLLLLWFDDAASSVELHSVEKRRFLILNRYNCLWMTSVFDPEIVRLRNRIFKLINHVNLVGFSTNLRLISLQSSWDTTRAVWSLLASGSYLVLRHSWLYGIHPGRSVRLNGWFRLIHARLLHTCVRSLLHCCKWWAGLRWIPQFLSTLV